MLLIAAFITADKHKLDFLLTDPAKSRRLRILTAVRMIYQLNKEIEQL